MTAFGTIFAPVSFGVTLPAELLQVCSAMNDWKNDLPELCFEFPEWLWCQLRCFQDWLENSVFLQIYLYDCTEVSPYCLLFFGGDISIQKDKDQDTIAVDEWIVFQSPARIAHLVKVTVFSNGVYGISV